MLPPVDSRFLLRVLFGFAVLALLLPVSSGAQEEQLEALRDDFRVIETSQGWALQPREDTEDYGLIEIHDDQVLIDGREVDEEELRRFVDEAAAQILEVARADARRAAEAEREEHAEQEREERRYRDSQVSFGTTLRVEHNEVVEEVVLLGGGLEVLGEIDGDATVVLGGAHVEGTIDGNLTVVGGPVHLLEGSRIEGELVAVGGRVHRERGSTVEGDVTHVATGGIDLDGIDIDFGLPNFHFFDNTVFDLLTKLFVAGFLLVVIFLAQFLAPRKIHRVSERVRQEPWKAGAVGLAVEVLFAPLLLLVTVLLTISIVGIPLLIVVPPALALMLVIYFAIGLSGVARWCGEQMIDRFELRSVGPYLLLLVGLLLIYGWSILGEVFTFTPWPIRATAFVLLFFGFVVKYVAWTIGLGAAVLDHFSPIATNQVDRWAPEREISDALPIADSPGGDE